MIFESIDEVTVYGILGEGMEEGNNMRGLCLKHSHIAPGKHCPGVRGTCNEILLRSNSDRSLGILCSLFLLNMREHTCTQHARVHPVYKIHERVAW